MIKLFPTSSSFRVYIVGFVILVGNLIFFTNSIHSLFLSATVLGQDVSITNNSTGLINQGKYLNQHWKLY